MSIVIDGTSGITPLAFSSNLQFTSTGQRITGDFSNSTVANRVMFQTSTTNGNTIVSVIPNGAASATALTLWNNSDPSNAGRLSLIASYSTTSIESLINGTGTYLPMTFYTGGSERMRIDTSGNVGIGMTPLTTSATSMFVNGPISINPYYGTYLVNAHYDGAWKYNANGVAWGIGNNFGGVTNGTTIAVTSVNSSGANAALTWTPAVNIDTSGNLGLGVTPSAWGSSYRILEIGRSGTNLFSNATNGNIGLYSNTYINSIGSPTYANNGYAGGFFVRSSDGTQIWNVANSGTAGDPITFTQAMTLDASGNLGIGTSSPGYKLHVSRGIAGDIANFTDGVAQSLVLKTNATSFVFDASNGGNIVFAQSNVEKMRIDSSGNVGIGTDNPGGARLNVTGTSSVVQFQAGTTTGGGVFINVYDGATAYNLAYSGGASPITNYVVGTQSNIPFSLFTNNSEKARIDTSGKVWINTNATTTSQYLYFGDATNAYAGLAGSYDSATTGRISLYTMTAGTATEKMRVDSTGTIYQYQGAPFNSNTAVTLSVANMQSGILTSTPAAAIAWTLPTGTVMDATLSSLPVNTSFDWAVLVISGFTVTITASTGHTLVGTGAVVATGRGVFRTRRTAANTWVTYRISA